MSAPTPPAVIPLYVKIAAEMRDQIQDGTYAPGSLLPSRNEITQMYSVSAITARDALSIICQEGLAKAVRGRGHIVRRQRSRMTVPSRLYDTAEPQRRRGAEPAPGRRLSGDPARQHRPSAGVRRQARVGPPRRLGRR